MQYMAFRIAFGILQVIPMPLAVRFAAWVASTLGPRRRQHKRALANLAIAFPEKSLEEREAVARAMWANMGRVVAETLFVDRIVETRGLITIDGRDVIERYRGKRGSIVAVTLHTGNWELAIWPLSAGGTHPAAVYRSFDNPLVNEFLMAKRAKLYPGGLFGKGRVKGTDWEGGETARLIIDYCRRGGRLGFVCDHVDKGGMPMPFFGRTARFTPVPAMIARRVGSRIWIGRCIREGTETRFRIETKELRVPRTSNPSDDVRVTTASIIAQFEAWIRENPDQWMWWNTRFLDLPKA